MKNINSIKLIKIIVSGLSIAALPLTSQAINGIYDYGYGQINRGMGGAGIAMPQEAFATTINPSGMNEVKHNFDAGVAIYFPDLYAKYGQGTAGIDVNGVQPLAGGIGTHTSQMKTFFMPDIAYIYHYDKRNHFGFSLASVGGYGSDYSTKNAASVFVPPPAGPAVASSHGLFGDGNVYSSLKIGTINASFNHVIDEYFSFGFTVSYYMQQFKSKGSAGLAAFTTRALQAGALVPAAVAAPHLSNNGYDYNYGVGATIAATIKPFKNITLAISATPTVQMSKMSKYKDLLVNKGELDIPGRYVVGLRYQANDRLDLVADVVRIMNSEVDSYRNNSRALFDGRCNYGTTMAEDCMGGKNGPGFGWSNQTLIKVGGAYKLTSKDTVRLGFSYGNKIGNKEDIVVQTFAPGAAAEWIFTGGYSRVMKNYKLNSFVTFIPKQTLDGVNELSVNNAQTIEVKVSGIGFGLGISI